MQTHAVFLRLERQQAFVHTRHHDVRPLEAFGGVQGGQGHHVLVFVPLGQRGQEGDGLRHFQQVFAFAHQAHTGGVVHLAATALGHPVDEIHHIGPAGGGQLLAFLAVVQMLFVVNVFEPLQQQRQRRFCALGVAGAKLQIVDLVAKGLQAFHRAGGQGRAQRMAEHRFEQADPVLVGELTQLLQAGVANAAFGRGDAAQKRRVVIVVHPQAQPSAQVADFRAVKKALAA